MLSKDFKEFIQLLNENIEIENLEKTNGLQVAHRI